MDGLVVITVWTTSDMFPFHYVEDGADLPVVFLFMHGPMLNILFCSDK